MSKTKLDKKIKLDTPADVMWDVMDRESDKAFAWYMKQAGGEKGWEKRRMSAAADKLNDPTGKGREMFRSTWQTMTDEDTTNKWLVTEIYHLRYYSRYTMLYYETSSSIGIYQASMINDKKVIHIFESHFFLRYCDEQHKLGHMDNDLGSRHNMLIKFLQQNPFFSNEECYNIYTDDDGCECVDLCLAGCVARGVVEHKDDITVYRFRSPLTWESMSTPQENACKPIIDAWLDLHEELNEWNTNFVYMLAEVDQLDNQSIIKIEKEMNQEQKDALKKVLKENGVTGFDTVASLVAKNTEQYYMYAEPVFAISRLLPYINSETEEKKTRKAQRQWMPIVINNDWCPMMKKYTDQYGKENVIKAIDYLIEQNLWDSPKGNKNLKSQDIKTYDCFEVIDNAIDDLTDKGQLVPYTPAPAKEEDSPIPANIKTKEELVAFVEQNTDNFKVEAPAYARCCVMDSFDCISEIDKYTDMMRKHLHTVLTHFEWEAQQEQTDMEKEAARLRREKTNLEVVLTEKNETIKRLREQQQEAQQNYVSKSQECDEQKRIVKQQKDTIDIKNDEIANQDASIKRMSIEISNLKQAATLPKKKVLKLSELSDLPLMGKKILSVLIPFLDKNGIFVDDKR